MKLRIDVDATDGAARTGSIATARGVLPTPLFMPVGTRAAVKTLDTADLESLGIPLVLGNTYHLMLRPGADVVAAMGGLHRFMDWSGHLLTDSGGYQIFSLEPKVTDDGATFRSTYDGSTHHLTPEGAVEVQTLLGADIQMVLDAVGRDGPAGPQAHQQLHPEQVHPARPTPGEQVVGEVQPGRGRRHRPGPVGEHRLVALRVGQRLVHVRRQRDLPEGTEPPLLGGGAHGRTAPHRRPARPVWGARGAPAPGGAVGGPGDLPAHHG